MWRMSSGDRVLTDAEWQVFAAGAAEVYSDLFADYLCFEPDDTGYDAIDRLTVGQRTVILADVLNRMRSSDAETVEHTASNEAMIALIISKFHGGLTREVRRSHKKQRTLYRRLLIRAIKSQASIDNDDNESDGDCDIPDKNCRDMTVWDDAVHGYEEMILWDCDYQSLSHFAGSGAVYFDSIPDEPTCEDARVLMTKMRSILGEWG